MNQEKPMDPIPNKMTDIKSERIFDIPPNYFNQLEGQFFDSNGKYIHSAQKKRSFRSHYIWSIAATIALVVSVAWWYSTDHSGSTQTTISETDLEHYIQSNIMDFDLEMLTQSLVRELSSPDVPIETGNYQSYIQENLDDFEDLLYLQ